MDEYWGWRDDMATAEDYRSDMYGYLVTAGSFITNVIDPNAKNALTNLLSAGFRAYTCMGKGLSDPDFAQEHLRWMIFSLWSWQLDHVSSEVTWQSIMQAWWDAPLAGWGWTIQFIDFMRKAVWNEPMNIIEQESFM